MYRQILNDTPFLSPADEHSRELMHKVIATLPTVETVTVGYSIRRRPIEMYKFGNGGGRVIFFGTHHALESLTSNILYTFIYIMNSHFRGKIPIKNAPPLFTSLYSYYVIPCLNPDGVEVRMNGDVLSPIYSRVLEMSSGDTSGWQANARGVDLNHNYDYRFDEYKRLEALRGITAGPTKFSGQYPESEPESRLAANLVRLISPIAVVSLHSQGEEIYYSPNTARRSASVIARMSGYSLARPTDTAQYGGLCDYTGQVLGIPSFTIEIGRGKNPLSESCIPNVLKRILEPLLILPSTI